MGQSCSCASVVMVDGSASPSGHNSSGGVTAADEQHPLHSCPDPLVYDLVRRNNPNYHQSKGGGIIGQHHLLYKKGKPPLDISPSSSQNSGQSQLTRLVYRKIKPESHTHIYAIRSPEAERPEQRPVAPSTVTLSKRTEKAPAATKRNVPTDLTVDPYVPQNMAPQPKMNVNDWVCVSEELDIYVCDTGLSHADCDQLVQTTEQVCKGHYAAYTYAKQTLGCREFPVLAHACWEPVHRVTHTIWKKFPASKKLQLDDREPHIVKYDVTKKERQKLDMHTDKSEWTFLIALSDGCGLDYEGGGTYFEALDATVHVQRGHALIFPGKLRHCGQRITKGLRFLLVGFLVDKASQQASTLKDAVSAAASGAVVVAGDQK